MGVIINAGKLLQTRFGYASFRPLQEEVITSVLRRRDTLAVLPTGGGKSLCYQLPALIFDGLTVVVSPLISLMQDQVMQLEERGIPSAVLNSSLEREQYLATLQRVRSGGLRLLYLAPETLLKPRVLELLESVAVDCLTVDEAHCISDWGHDFRGEYRQLADVRERFGGTVFLALTATATPAVQRDIVKSLCMREPDCYVAGFDRKNFYLDVLAKKKPDNQVENFLREHPGEAGIIYCLSRRQVDKLTAYLVKRGVNARAYHAGLSDEERRRNQQDFVEGRVDVIVATVAFGMGIDKPDIRFVLHYDLPQDLESYYQQIGRAGRDGGAAHCRLLFGYGDIRKIRFFIEQKSGRQQRAAEGRLQAMIDFAESPGCRRLPLLRYFGEEPGFEQCGSCDVCREGDAGSVDVTLEMQQLFSCVLRTGERFGATHLIDVLTGNATEKSGRHGHDRLSVWGVGSHWGRTRWQQLIRLLLRTGLLEREERYGSLLLTEAGREKLAAREQLKLRMPRETAAPQRSGAVPQGFSAGPARAPRLPSPERGAATVLRKLRTILAKADGVPAYRVYNNRTLEALAEMMPETVEDLLEVPGVGPVKAERYGDAIIKTIRDLKKL